MRRRFSKRKHQKEEASLQITSMADILTIILVFLIKSYSVDPAFLTPTQNISLAMTTSEQAAPDKAVMIVGHDGILIEGKLIVPFKNGEVSNSDVKGGELPELRKTLEEMATKTKFIADV